MISETFMKRVKAYIEDNNIYKEFVHKDSEAINSNEDYRFSVNINITDEGTSLTFILRGANSFNFTVNADTVEHAFNRAYSVLKAYSFKSAATMINDNKQDKEGN